METVETDIEQKLMEPFEPTELKWKPAMVKGDRAMALVYVDARVIQDRLDNVLGVLGWQDSYKQLDNGSVICTLQIKLAGEWISKMDVGSPSEQPDEGDRLKAAFSDALKRAAVKFGIGRYLYRFPRDWVAYDAQKKRIVQPPRLPDWAIPKHHKNGEASKAAPGPAAPSAPPQQRIEPPFVSDCDPHEFISDDCVDYLMQLLDDKGFSVKTVLSRFPTLQGLNDLIYQDYQKIVEGLNSRPDRKVVANASR